MWTALHQSGESLKSKNRGFPQKKEFCLKTVAQKPCLSFQPMACPTNFRFASPVIMCDNFLKYISLALSHPD